MVYSIVSIRFEKVISKICWSIVKAIMCKKYYCVFVSEREGVGVVYICIVVWKPIIRKTGFGFNPVTLFVPVPCQELDSQHNVSWSHWCSMIWGERWQFILLIIVELLAITVKYLVWSNHEWDHTPLRSSYPNNNMRNLLWHMQKSISDK